MFWMAGAMMNYKSLKDIMIDRFDDLIYDRLCSSILSIYIIIGIAAMISLPVTEIFFGILSFLILDYLVGVINTLANNSRDRNRLG